MNSKEKDILDWEFEELLRQFVLGYLKLNNFQIIEFSTSLDTHRETKEIYDIVIKKREVQHEDS